MNKLTSVGVIVVAVAAGNLLGCGSSETPEGAAPPTAPPPPASELHTEHLPPSLAFVRMGESTPEEIKGHFTAENLYVTDDGERNLTVRAMGPNTGRPQRTVNVTRTQNGQGYVGELGDDYGSIRFVFTPLTDGGPFVLFQVEVSQRGTTGNVCQPAAPLAAGTGLEGCDANDVYRPSAPGADGAFHACVNHTDGRVLFVHCSTAGDSRMVRYELAVGRQEAPAATP